MEHGLATTKNVQFDDWFPQQAKQRIEPLLPILAWPSRFVTVWLFGRFPGVAVGAENQQCDIQWLPGRPFGCGRQVGPTGKADEQCGESGQGGDFYRLPSASCISRGIGAHPVLQGLGTLSGRCWLRR
jgi:hypothetical protein